MSTFTKTPGWLDWHARPSTPQALDQLLVAEIDKWKQVVARAKIEKQ